MFGENIKIHFAGSEQIDFSSIASKAGVKYFLFTCFPFINRQLGLKGYPVTCKTLFPPAEIAKFSKHTIMDSGLFTLMFGALKGQEITKDFLTQYTDALIDFVNTKHIKATCVEVDCQKVLGVDEAWYFRQYMRDRITSCRLHCSRILRKVVLLLCYLCFLKNDPNYCVLLAHKQRAGAILSGLCSMN